MAQKKKKKTAPKEKETKRKRSASEIIFIGFAILMVFLMVFGAILNF